MNPITVVNGIIGDLRFRVSCTFTHWKGDLTGGLTASVVALPLALAFAVASGVDPKAGLYSAIVAGIVAALFGGSPVQITGPTGAMAVILVGIVSQYGIEKVWIAGLLAGIIQISLGNVASVFLALLVIFTKLFWARITTSVPGSFLRSDS